MRRTVVLSALVGLLLSPIVAHAEGNHPMAGCGLGYILFGKDLNSKGAQIGASILNSFYWIQTFGISSGSSGCTPDGMVAMGQEVEVYVAVNLPNLAAEMAKGEGEYLNAFAALLGTSEQNRPALLSFFQEKYEVLFPSEETNSIEMLEALRKELESRPDLLG